MERRFFADPARISGPELTLSGPDANHIRNVLRLKPGDRIRLFDGTGAEYAADIAAFDPDGVRVAVLGPVRTETESPAEITIAQGFLKDKKMDGLVRQLTELGITRWIPFMAVRSVARPDAKRLAARRQRWEKIVRESLKQCRRSRVPEITDTVSFEEMLRLAGPADLKLMFWEDQRMSPAFDLRALPARRYQRVFAVLGPEGGLSREEADQAGAAGFLSATLGPRILRAETATIAACTLLQHCFGDM
ncbi:16S rRNA (uracil(1498)-N(3))-methyltransferase [Desulfonema ishimotonii]|uniref:Ribosomal RNA small subunit methyltransferase E n=1 Tax=Desulfonema ishimotonii TaxID=45657 RepID=A0A401G1P1_9BACT|nr:16S rRNA (uracil(1498)-N(3))-methyltransferase [Desulfonema ishimotonii]GBC63126.1 16S rRNA (uracil(1498)-N(3))-methyltransferase [Desulfonema ishimotonii]